MPVTNFDIWDQAQLTGMIRRALQVGREKTPSLADQIAPFFDVQQRKIKYRVVEPEAFGVGQLRAPDGDPKLFRSKVRYRDELIELALPDEMERIGEDTMLRLQSSDPDIKQSGGLDVVTRGEILALRNWRRVEKMRWDMFLTGIVETDMEDSSAKINFGMAADQFVTAATAWSNFATAKVVDEVRSWQKLVADRIGHYALRLHMNTNTWELIWNNQQVRDLMSSYGRSLMVPTREDISALFREGTQIIVYDGGFRDSITEAVYDADRSRGNTQLTQWLPDNKILITTEYQIDGQRIADTPNGPVMVATGYNTLDRRQGPQAETIIHPVSHNTMLRYARAAIPRMLEPNAFLVATV